MNFLIRSLVGSLGAGINWLSPFVALAVLLLEGLVKEFEVVVVPTSPKFTVSANPVFQKKTIINLHKSVLRIISSFSKVTRTVLPCPMPQDSTLISWTKLVFKKDTRIPPCGSNKANSSLTVMDTTVPLVHFFYVIVIHCFLYSPHSRPFHIKESSQGVTRTKMP